MKSNNKMIVIAAFALACATLTLTASAAVYPQLTLTNGTADFSQPGGFSPDLSVNGAYLDVFGFNELGWAVDAQYGVNHVAAWNTTSPVLVSAGSEINFVIHHDFGYPNEVLGHFRLSVTTGTTPLSGNDNNAASINALTWTQLIPTSVSTLTLGHSIAIQGDNSMLVTGNGLFDVLTIRTTVPALSGAVTGIRLEALTFGGGQGPGLAGGNFVVTEIEAFVPEPSAAVALIGLCGLALRRRSGRMAK